jgi:AcrR family transcriptional regulator
MTETPKTKRLRKAKSTYPLTPQTRPDRVLNEAFWLSFGETASPTTKQRILYIAIDDVARVGPTAFSTQPVAQALGITVPLVNFHFGGRDELLAAGLIYVYEAMVSDAWDRVAAARQNPEARLRAWLTSITDSYRTMGGWGVLINYPVASENIIEIIRHEFGQELVDLAELNLARLLLLVKDLQKKKVSDTALELGKLPKLWFVTNPRRTALTVSVALALSGMAIWLGGRDRDQAAKEGAALEAAVVKLHLNRIIASI